MRSVFIAALLLPTFCPGQNINIAFHNGQTTVNGMATRPAGSVVTTATKTWNNVANTDGIGLAFSDFVLRDSNGSDTGARLAANAGTSAFNSNGWGSNTQDWVMMEGWYGIRSSEAITVSGLPSLYSSGFSVIVYGDSNVANVAMNYTIGGQTRTIQDSANFNGTFTDGTNFTRFDGLSGTTFSLTGNPGVSAAYSAVNGMIIVPAPVAQAPVIASFTVNDAYVSPGASATLSWNVQGATSLAISPTPGTVSGASGSTTVTVSNTTTYTLTATNAGGQTTAKVRVGAGPPRPNILFVLVDDMGWQDTSVPFLHDSNGNPVVTPLNQRYRTPGMETLASRGMKFTNAYAMPVCTPSRNCWITGLNSVRHHVTNWTNISGTDTDENSTTSHNSPADWEKGGLSDSRVTLPSLLQAAGYRTIHAGKAHFGSTAYAHEPLNIGFDVNIAGSEIGHPASYFGTANFGTGTHHVPGLDAYHGQNIFLTEALTLEMNKALEDAVAGGAPFFAYMAHYAVHSPFQTDPRFSGNYPGLTGNQLAYATLIEGMDKSLGDILTKLEQLGVAEDTLVVFMSDNGGDAPMASVDESNAPLRHKKGSKYEGGIREPMIVSWAKRDAANAFQTALPIPAASREDDIVAIFDFFPTFASVAGVAVPSGIDGHDLSPYLRGLPGNHRPQKLLIHFPHDHRSDYFTIFREESWKLIYNFPTESYELYNLSQDLSETTDLAAAEPERVMRMSRRMAARLNEAGAQWPRFATGGAEDPFQSPNLPAVDADGDGIPDITEDPNSNGLVDPGETSPDNDNTDGDPTPDGAEIRTGTDPLDSTSFFRATPELLNGNFMLTWPSSPGATYRVEEWAVPSGTWITSTDDIPASPGNTTTHNAGPTTGSGIFRVFLK